MAQIHYRSRIFDIEGVSKDDHIFRHLVRLGGFYELDLLEYIEGIKDFINENNKLNIAIDVGSNIGNHAIFFSSFLADYLIAIEPNPQVLEFLRRNLSINIDNYTLVECAVGDESGKGTIVLPEQIQANVGTARVDTSDGRGGIEISTVDSVLSHWKEGYEGDISVSLIKIDVEGMETQVLKGAESTIRQYKPHIFVEAATKEEFDRIQVFLNSFGYRKMPGRWAGTPVYHFAPNPNYMLSAAAHFWQAKRLMRKIRARLTRRTG